MERNVESGFSVELHSVEIVQSWKGQVLDTELVSLDRPRRIAVGEVGRFLLPIGESFDLVVVENRRAVASVPARATALVSEGESTREIGAESADRTFVIGASTSLELTVGDMTFYVRPVQKEAAKFEGPIFDGTGSRWIAAALAFHVAILATFFFMPPDASALSSDLTGEQLRYVQVHLDAMQETPPPALPTSGGDSTGGGTSAPSSTAPGGGDTPTPAVSGGPGTAHRHPVSVRGPVTADDVRELGTFQQLAMQLASLTGDDSPYVTGNGTDGIGGPGTALVPGGLDGFGPGGLHLTHGVGTCTGEHCGDGTIDQGGFDTTGGNDVGPGPSLPTHDPHMTTPGVRLVCTATSTDPACRTVGGLTREQIRSVIARHRPEVRYCYEQALQSRPDLQGRVTVGFQVAADGHVAQSSASGMSGVDSCVAQAVERWHFPSSTSATIVSYPFVLESSESQ